MSTEYVGRTDHLTINGAPEARLTRAEWKAIELAEAQAGAEVLREWRQMFVVGLSKSGLREPYASETADFLLGWCAGAILARQSRPAAVPPPESTDEP